ncbi:MAG: hypothetical protein QOG33_706 [Gaiellales bacterium]|nr:hypothetical protein [Gaiellales bacterium]
MAARGVRARAQMIRGSVVIHRRRCGKPNCRCADGQALHESTVLHYSEQGQTRVVMLPAEEVAAVTAAVQRYQAAQATLTSAGEAGRAELLARLAAGRGRR